MRFASGFKRKIGRNLAANGVGQAFNIFMLLTSVPILLSIWGVEQYGQWLIISAIPAYFALADAGMGTAASNRMSQFGALKEMALAQKTFSTALKYGSIFVAAAISLLGIVYAVALEKNIYSGEIITPLYILIAATLIGLSSTLIEAVWRASDSYATGVNIVTGMRASEWLGTIIGAFIFRTIEAAALGTLLFRILGTAAAIRYSQRSCPSFSWGFKSASTGELKSLVSPSVGYLSFPIGNALLLQGPIIIAGVLFGPGMAAMIGTYRTIARAAVQLVSVFSHSLWPEFSRMYSLRDYQIIVVYKKACLIAVASAALLMTAQLLLMPYILTHWTRGKVGFDLVLASLICSAAFIACVSHVPRTLVLAAGSPERLGGIYLCCTLLLNLVMVGVASHFSIYWVTALSTVCEVIIMIACMYFAFALLKRL